MDINSLKNEYAKNNPNSKRAWESACEIIPGGITANVKFFSPFPLFMKEGNGAWVTDLDNHRYVDYVLSYGPLILGHGRKEIIDAINKYFSEHGTMLYGTPHIGELEFAKLLQKYYPSLEMMRFTNSGTEATLLSIRTACAFTGKHKIAKFEGHYHGGFNEVLVSIKPDVNKAGDIKRPISIPESAGLPEEILKDTIILPFNDLDSCKEILTNNKEEISCVIMEPMYGGTIPATKEFMKGIREITSELGILLIMDEVKTGFRVGMTGAQGYYDVIPDLTTMGKIIGAGLPVGLLGGRKDIMEMAAPMGSDKLYMNSHKRNVTDVLYHSGTYNGHPLILSLGIETVQILESEMDALIERTEYMKTEVQNIFAKHGVRVLTPGVGAMFNICVTDQEDILTYRDFKKCNFDLRRRIDYAMFLNGVYCKPCTRYHLSTAHTYEVIDYTLEALEKAWNKMCV